MYPEKRDYMASSRQPSPMCRTPRDARSARARASSRRSTQCEGAPACRHCEGERNVRIGNEKPRDRPRGGLQVERRLIEKRGPAADRASRTTWRTRRCWEKAARFGPIVSVNLRDGAPAGGLAEPGDYAERAQPLLLREHSGGSKLVALGVEGASARWHSAISQRNAGWGSQSGDCGNVAPSTGDGRGIGVTESTRRLNGRSSYFRPGSGAPPAAAISNREIGLEFLATASSSLPPSSWSELADRTPDVARRDSWTAWSGGRGGSILSRKMTKASRWPRHRCLYSPTARSQSALAASPGSERPARGDTSTMERRFRWDADRRFMH